MHCWICLDLTSTVLEGERGAFVASPSVMDIFFFSFYLLLFIYLDLTHIILESSRLHEALYSHAHRLEVFNFWFLFSQFDFYCGEAHDIGALDRHQTLAEVSVKLARYNKMLFDQP